MCTDAWGRKAALHNAPRKPQRPLSRALGAERLAKLNSGETVVVGRNKWTEGLPSPLLGGEDRGIFKVDPASAGETLEMLRATKARSAISCA